jgi:major membrane immunogen (membrane-anchored lipoprotein)
MLSVQILMFAAFVCALLIACAVADQKKGDMNAYYKRTGQKYLDEKAKEDGVLKLKSGMLVEV